MSRTILVALTVICAIVAGGTGFLAAAPVPNTWNYEGILTASNGQPVSDGNYEMVFNLYAVETGGSSLLANVFAAVPVAGGHFSVQLNFDTVPLDQDLWLGIKIGTDPEMSPRMRVTPSPGALGVPIPFSYDGDHPEPVLHVANLGSGPAMRVEGLLNVGSPTRTGHLAFRTSGLTTPGFELEAHSSGQGGLLSLRDDGGNTYFELGPEGTEGVLLKMWRNESDLGFLMRSKVGGSPNPSLELHAAQGSVVFDMSQAGDSSVQLYTDGIRSHEILDEPGCASLVQTTAFGLSGTLGTVASRTIVAPAAGYVLTVATCEVGFQGTLPALASVVLGLTAGSALPVNQDVMITTPPGLASSETVPVSLHGLFAVGAGNTTISLRGYEANAFTEASIRDVQISLIYVPTAYGTVVATAPGLLDFDQLSLGPAGENRIPLTEVEVNEERAREEALAVVRLEQELRLIQVRTERLRTEIDWIAAGRNAKGDVQ